MKRILTIFLALCMILCAAGCANNQNAETSDPVESGTSTDTAAPSVNEGELQMGVYGGSASYTEGEFGMTWIFTIAFREDGSFTLINDAGEEKGAGTYALTDTCYTMTYSDDRTATFVILADGTMKFTAALPYGQNSISPEMVGGIELTYTGEKVESGSDEAGTAIDTTVQAGDCALTAGTYTASYTKESAMAGTVTYNYTAEIGADGSFSYSVTFKMGETQYDGSAATGTYTLENGVFVFADSEGNVIEGKLTANDTLVISLMASAMAKEPYEVTFTNGSAANIAAILTPGTYTASYTKESAMAGTVTYNYTAEVGADGTFSYSVTFKMGETQYDGSTATGTYTLENGVFVFTDSEGNVIEGMLTANDTLVISLMASAMAKEPYEVTFVPVA